MDAWTIAYPRLPAGTLVAVTSLDAPPPLSSPPSSSSIDRATLTAATERLQQTLLEIGPLVVALSGGVDSTLLMVAAAKTLPPQQVIAVTADSDSLATGERDQCRHLADTWGVAWQAAQTNEMSDPRYLANNMDRCYWCKSALMDQLTPIASERNATVVLGVNVDDLGDHRPGQEAAAAGGARFPLVEAGFTKTMIRELALAWGVEVWDRPAMPCLASRIPYGTTVSISLLSRIDRAEQAIRRLGFADVRVRDYDETARIEVPPEALQHAVDNADEIVAALTTVGYQYVTLDLAGLRSGNLNRSAPEAAQTCAADPAHS